MWLLRLGLPLSGASKCWAKHNSQQLFNGSFATKPASVFDPELWPSFRHRRDPDARRSRTPRSPRQLGWTPEVGRTWIFLKEAPELSGVELPPVPVVWSELTTTWQFPEHRLLAELGSRPGELDWLLFVSRSWSQIGFLSQWQGFYKESLFCKKISELIFYNKLIFKNIVSVQWWKNHERGVSRKNLP